MSNWSSTDTNSSCEPTNETIREVRRVAQRAARRYGASAHEADEVAQITTEKLYRVWNTPSIIKARRGWWEAYVYRVARNAYLDLIRSYERREARERKAAGQPVEEGLCQPATHFDAHMARIELLDLIRQLPEADREVAGLYFCEGLSSREIARTTNLAIGTVTQSLRRAKQLLSQQLLREVEEQDASHEPAIRVAAPSLTKDPTDEIDITPGDVPGTGVGRDVHPVGGPTVLVPGLVSEGVSVDLELTLTALDDGLDGFAIEEFGDALDDGLDGFAIEGFGDALDDPDNLIGQAVALVPKVKLRQFLTGSRKASQALDDVQDDTPSD